jgi:IS30 family transposase
VRNLNWTPHRFKTEERRRQVAFLLSKSVTETKIAKELRADRSTISIDVKALKGMSQRFGVDQMIELLEETSQHVYSERKTR